MRHRPTSIDKRFPALLCIIQRSEMYGGNQDNEHNRLLGTVNENLLTLRLVWPQWQGAGVESIRELFSEVPFEEARRGYAVGAAVLNAVLPAHTGPTALVPVESGDLGLSKQDGIEAKEAVVAQLARALEVIGRYSPERILTLGGECSVSVAPFSWLTERYGDDLAVLWIDSHPDVGTPVSQYPGYHAMAVAVLTGHGNPDVLRLLPATLDPGRVALVGLHSWTEDDFPNVARWGIRRLVLTIFTSPVSRFSIGSRHRGARVLPSILMSMSWIATRSSSVLVRSLTA